MPSRTARDVSPDALKQFHPFKRTPESGLISTASQEKAKETAEFLAKVLKERFNVFWVINTH
jgi:hypothetical protein